MEFDETADVTPAQWDYLLQRCERPPFGLPGPSPTSIYLRREIAGVVADMLRGYGRMRPTLHDGHIGAVGGE